MITPLPTDTKFTSVPITDFPDGHALVTVFCNGIPSVSKIILVDNPPTAHSIARSDPSPTNAVSVNFTVTFSENVTGVDTGNFILPDANTVTGGTISKTSNGSAGLICLNLRAQRESQPLVSSFSLAPH